MTDTFHVRLGNLVPNAPPVDFLVDGHPVLSDRAFGQVNDYTTHEAAEYAVGVRNTATTSRCSRSRSRSRRASTTPSC